MITLSEIGLAILCAITAYAVSEQTKIDKEETRQ